MPSLISRALRLGAHAPIVPCLLASGGLAGASEAQHRRALDGRRRRVFETRGLPRGDPSMYSPSAPAGRRRPGALVRQSRRRTTARWPTRAEASRCAVGDSASSSRAQPAARSPQRPPERALSSADAQDARDEGEGDRSPGSGSTERDNAVASRRSPADCEAGAVRRAGDLDDRRPRIAMWSGPRNLSTALMRSFENRADCSVVDEPLYAAYLAATGLDHPGRDEVIASQPTDPATVVAELTQRAAGDAGAVPEAHDPPPAPGVPARAAVGSLTPRVPGPRPGAGADVVREGPRRADAGGPRAAAAARAVRDVRRAGGRRRRRAARPARDARAAVRRARDRLRRGDARLARRAAGHRRRLGAALVRRRRGLDRLRAVLPRLGRPAARPAGAAAGAVPSVLRGAGAVPPRVPEET